jgi:hypothetical protein
MDLRERIRDLRLDTRRKLIAANDHFHDLQRAWDLVRSVIRSGRHFSYSNPTTGTVTTQVELAARLREYQERLALESTFQQFISLFENFFFDLLRFWLTAYPRGLGNKQIDLHTILDSPDHEAIILAVVNKELNAVMNEKPAQWFAYLQEKIKMVGPTPDQIDRLTEAKATRDILIHNGGVANKVYVAKAGKLARAGAGEILVVSEPYHRQVWEVLLDIVDRLTEGALRAASSP